MLFRERRQIVLFGAAVLMVGGFVLFRYLPLRERMATVKLTKAAERKAVNEEATQDRLLPVLEEQARDLSESIGDYEAKIPLERELGAFLGRITDLMNEHNLKEQVVTPGGEVKSGELNCIPVDIQCRGNLAEMFEFFKGLQSLERLVRIEQIKLSNDADFSGEVRLETRAVIYYQTAAALRSTLRSTRVVEG
ncbi:MAG TPA: type 4a pilus biogenesis protein PilO [Sedimentisphaerales bacterium]|nr:type 4a pilus biogenesis protein PilO [Sedimentisphaerales bacterium]